MGAEATLTESTESTEFDRKIGRLVDLSVGQGHDAFADIAWDDPELAVDPTDPRLKVFPFDPLADTDWYRSLPEAEQARVGLQRTAANLRIGWEFENLLQQGLLARAYRMDNSQTAFPYLHHEVMEESQHTMMFYEFNRRYAPEVHGMPSLLKAIGDRLTSFVCRRFPALFYFMVLGGEVPVDYLQRRMLREADLHPLVERITSIHVEEEARHVSFANQELRRRVPALSTAGRHTLALVVPAVLAVMARLMVYPSPWLLAVHDVPRGDISAALSTPRARRVLAESCERIRSLAEQLGLMTRPARAVWRAAGLLPPDDG